VFKTLIADVDGALTVAVVPVTGDLDLKALAAATGGKRAVLAERAAAERVTVALTPILELWLPLRPLRAASCQPQLQDR
jgi:hypothetical protein